jgi:hypothetical protein
MYLCTKIFLLFGFLILEISKTNKNFFSTQIMNFQKAKSIQK